jgi:hypothetical protein
MNKLICFALLSVLLLVAAMSDRADATLGQVRWMDVLHLSVSKLPGVVADRSLT